MNISLDSSDVIQLIILLVLLFLSAFFSSAETAMTTVNRIRIRSLADDGNARAKTLLKITDDPAKFLSAILIGNNIVNLSAASLTTSLAYGLGGSMVAIASGILTLLILLFGEITPKTMATIHSEKISLLYAPVISIFIRLMTPVIFIVNGLANIILRIIHVDPNANTNVMTENDLRTIVDVSHEDGVIESEEKEMINNVFDLGDAKAKDVMVPRVHVTFADVNSTYDELIDIFREDKFTRLPIFEDTTDNVIGTINMKDLLLYDNKKDFHLRDILREAYFTYEEDFIKEIGPHEYLVEGSTNLEEINDRLDLDLSSDDYDSVGGLIIEHLDRLPEAGDEITTEDGIRMIVEKLDKNRIEQVHMYLPEQKKDEEAGE